MGEHSHRTSGSSSNGDSCAAPSTISILTSLSLPNRPPASALGALMWRFRMWFECTFAFTMLEPWEKVLCAVVVATLFLLVGTGFVQYFPPHVKTMYDRAMYYWSGDVPALVNRPQIDL